MTGPLSGIRVLELGSTVAGPFCGRLLADFGAEVIKVEPPEGDPVREMGGRHEGRSLYARSILRNRRLVALDLRQDGARAVARRLAAGVDILIENFRPGTLEGWGLGYDDLARDNPGLIMVRISGFGQDGPYRGRAGYGVVCEAVGGVRELTGDPDRPPSRSAVSQTDCLAGLYGAFGAVMALRQRALTGRGQVIDSALYEAAFSLMEPYVPAFAASGVAPRRSGSRLPGNVPNNLYATADGRHVHIAAASNAVFRRVCQVIGRPELADDPRFATAAARVAHEDALDAIIGAWTGARPLAEAEVKLLAAKVPAARVYTLADIFADPHYRARGMLVDSGETVVPGVVPRLSDTPGTVRWTGGNIGADTWPVLREAGYSDADIAGLAAAGALGAQP